MERKAYIEKLEAQLHEWNGKIDELKSRTEKVKEEKKKEYREQLEILHTKQEAAKKKLHDLREASDEAWQNIKSGVDNSWSELKTAIHNATEKFK
jgi:TolA-binding protein